jgi:hypothetical protein
LLARCDRVVLQPVAGNLGDRTQRVALDRKHAFLLGHALADDRRRELPDIVGIIEGAGGRIDGATSRPTGPQS